MTKNTKIAFMAALFMCFSYYNLEIISGYMGMDRNDGCFDFYVLASIWAFAEYRQRQKISWVLLVGIFAGFAILTKWLTGLLVFGGWGICISGMIRDKTIKKEILHFFIALLACCIVFIPWQVYIFHAFPVEARYELNYNSRHVTEVMEQFSGTIWFYYERFPVFFGYYIWVLVIAGLLIMPLIKKYRNSTSLAVVVDFLLVFIFFSFIAKTKIATYFMVAVPFGFIFIAIATFHTLEKLRVIKYTYMPAGIALALTVFNLPLITDSHDKTRGNGWSQKTYNTEIIKRLKNEIPQNTTCILNLTQGAYIDCMFYNNRCDAYCAIPDESAVNELKAKNIKLAVFDTHGVYDVPNYILNYPGVYIIHEKLTGQ